MSAWLSLGVPQSLATVSSERADASWGHHTCGTFQVKPQYRIGKAPAGSWPQSVRSSALCQTRCKVAHLSRTGWPSA